MLLPAVTAALRLAEALSPLLTLPLPLAPLLLQQHSLDHALQSRLGRLSGAVELRANLQLACPLARSVVIGESP